MREAICAFANDMPNHGKPGILFVGVNDDGSCAQLEITDQLLQTLADMRSDGNILPIPSLTVQKRNLRNCEMAVVIVHPSDFPPVRFNGRVCIRVGPRRATASVAEERQLSEKRRARDLPFDLRPMGQANLGDFDLDLFRRTYLQAAVDADVLVQNERSVEQQLASVRFVSSDRNPVPTVVGLLAIGKSPADYIPGAYVQFLRVEGESLADPIADQKECHGPLPDVLRQLDEILRANIHITTDIESESLERQTPDYPLTALQQYVRNAVMHRDYDTSHAPIRLTWFSNRMEIQNPGGPFGQVTTQNFGQPGITDYRNPNIAEVMKTLGFVQRFGVGLQIARRALALNGNPAPSFDIQDNHVLVTVMARGNL
jgi:ATP-dependent DNA helicase RecG